MVSDVKREQFEQARDRHFDPLCRKLGLTVSRASLGVGFAAASAEGGSIRLYFEYERGLRSFSVGSVFDSKPLCSVEEIAGRFPRIRLLGEGLQRLSLDEQISFVDSRWQDLQTMFSPEHLAETRKWRAGAVAESMKKWTGER